jgi:aspartyl-tRNA synthetase
MGFVQRSIMCGEPRLSDVGKQVVLNGWAHKVRDLGGLFFVDLRDRSGITQLIFDPARFPNLGEIKSETCLSVSGEVGARKEEVRNPKMATGDIEVSVSGFTILNQARPLPFQLSDEEQMQNVNEELRVKYRYLDLRRPNMYRNLALRAAIIRNIRNYLDARDFVDVETPIITRSTPEGARDYLVPYRLQPGQFYALPQSPQQYKQLLMVGGIERYYQIAKCFRDESQRADRQPEFTQLDLEMSFVTQEDILQLMEGLLRTVINALIEEFKLDKDPIEPFERLSYDESMHLYGNDKPDLRFGLQLFDITDAVRGSDFGVFKSTIENGGVIRGVRYPGGASLSRKEVGQLEEFCKEFGAKGMANLGVEAAGAGGEEGFVSASGLRVKGSIAKFLKPAELEEIIKASGAEAGDLLCFIADTNSNANTVLSRLRLLIGDKCGLRNPRTMKYCWVLDFPLVEWNQDENRWDATHHPFTAPKEEDLVYLDSDPGRIRADCYDVVCNGLECASGSIRIHRSDVQAKVFSLLGISEQTQRERFGHMLDAFSFGAPPHGGIAPGIDRMVMMLTDNENIREVIAFPKMGNGYDPMMDAPSTVDDAQWKELGLQVTKPTKV